MPIRRFRSLSDAAQTHRIPPGTPEFSRAVRSVFRMAAMLAPPRGLPPGVHKFRSIEEANAQKLLWEKQGKRTRRP